jgi:N-acetylmuramoyl-L-alanine amidase
MLPVALIANLSVLSTLPAFAGESSCAPSAAAAQPSAAALKPTPTAFADAGQLIAAIQRGRDDVPRIELAARLAAAGFAATDEYRRMREDAARELAGRPDGAGNVSADELRNADAAIAREIQILRGTLPPPSFAALARLPGRPQIEGLTIVYLNPLGDPARANAWQNIIVHQTEGPPGSARREATDQFAHPTKRGVTLWVETDGKVYWSVAENLIPTHGEGGDRNDNKYIDNTKTYHQVVKTNSIGVEFIGNYPDVAKPVTAEQKQAWLLLAPFLQERYGIAPDHIYAHNWIDFKDQRYCEGCELAALARKLGYCPSKAL